MDFLGMNTDQLTQFGDSVRSTRTELEELLAALDAEVMRSSDYWIGQDGENFRTEWQTNASELGRQVSEALQQRADEADAHVAEQEHASSVDGSEGLLGSEGLKLIDPFSVGSDRGSASPEAARAWQSMTDGQRRAAAQSIINEQFARYGLEPVRITFEPMQGNGYWQEGHRKLAINPGRLHDPDIMHTLAHEVRHAAQYEFVRQTNQVGSNGELLVERNEAAYREIAQRHQLSREEVDAFRSNFNNYVVPPPPPGPNPSPTEIRAYQEGFDNYLNQPVEVDARGAGREFLNNVRPEQLEGYQRLGGAQAGERIGSPSFRR